MKDNCLNGKVFKSNGYGDFMVIDHKNWRNVTVKFLETGYEIVTRVDKIKSGSIRDRMLPSYFGVGFLEIEDIQQKLNITLFGLGCFRGLIAVNIKQRSLLTLGVLS